jgi:gliding motility-associated-like protein
MKKTLLLLFFFISFHCLHGQSASTKGTEFWVTFMQNYTGSGMKLTVHFSAQQNSVVTITNPRTSYTKTLNVPANTLVSDTVSIAQCYNTGSGGIVNKGLKITATTEVTMYALNYISATADATVIFPTPALGINYRVISYKGLMSTLPSEYAIMATQDSTWINITPFCNTVDNKIKNVTYSIMMNKGQTYQSQSKTDSSLTGTLIQVQNCKPIAVWGGAVCSNVPVGCSACDHLYEQLFPLNMWGKSFILIPTATRSKDRYAIVADKSNTTITINGTPTTITNAGANYEADLTTPLNITADKPIAIAIFAVGGSCGGTSGDPMMMWVTPIEQNIISIIFVAQSSAIINNHYVSIVAKTSTIGSIKLNGTNIGSLFATVPSNTKYSYVKKSVSPGANTITSDSGFTAYAYGYGNYESYGYNVGSSIRDLNRFFTINSVNNDNFSTPATSLKICKNAAIAFNGNSGSYAPLYWLWKFNDDTASTQNVTKTFTDTGLVKVMMITSWIGSNLCTANDTTLDTAVQYVRVIDPKINILTSDTAVCVGNSFQVRVAISGGDSTVFWNASPNLSCTICAQPVITPSGSKWYKVNLGGGSLGCTVSDSIYVHLIDTIHLSISHDTLICAGQKAQLRAKVLNPDSTTNYIYKLYSNNIFIKQDTIGYFEVNEDTTTTFVVKANNGCSNDSSPLVHVFVRPPLKVLFTDSFLICRNQNSSFTFKASGGDSTYSVYLIENNNIIDSISNAVTNTNYSFSFTPDPASSYRLSLKDGCTVLNDSPLVHFTYRAPLSFTHTPDTLVCKEQSILLNVRPFGGDSTYTFYLLKNNTIVDSILNTNINNYYHFIVAPATNTTYQIVLKDGCTILHDTQTVTVSVRNPLAFSVSNDSNVCEGILSSIFVKPNGGDGSYTFFLLDSTVKVDSIFNAVLNQTYQFDVHPTFKTQFKIVLSDGCTFKNDTQSVIYTFRAPLNFTHTPDTTICIGQTIPIKIKPFGGDSTYSFYLLKNNGIIDSIKNAALLTSYSFFVTPTATTNYTVVLSDGCTYLNDTQNINVVLRNPLNLSVANSNIICRGQYLNIAVIPTGGDSTYSIYLLNNNLTIDSVKNAVSNFTYYFNRQPALNASYKFILKDGCTSLNDTQQVSFGFRESLSFSCSNDSTICKGQNSLIRITPFGGDSTYTFYLLKNNLIIDSIQNATIGNGYSFTVSPTTNTTYKILLKDGCTLLNDSHYVNVNVRSPLTFTASIDSFICEGTLSSIYLIPHGGDSTYTFYLLDSTSIVDSILYAVSNQTYQFDVHPKFITRFSVVLTDGCTLMSDTQTLVYTFRHPLAFTHSPDSTICKGRPITLSITPFGGDSTYYIYLLKNNSIVDSIKNATLGVLYSFTVTPAATALFSFVLTDGCTYLNDTQNINVAVRNPLNLSVVNSPIICRGQYLDMAATPIGGDSLYSIYLLNNNAIIDSIKNAASNITYHFNPQPALNASYKIVLKDGCTILDDTQQVNFDFREALSFTTSNDSTICLGQNYPIRVTPYGGDSTYTFYLLNNNSIIDSMANATIANNYYFTVAPITNTFYKIVLKDGCTLINDTHSVNISVRKPLSFIFTNDAFICEGSLSTIRVTASGGDSTYTFYLLDSTVVVDTIKNAIANQLNKFYVHPTFKTHFKVVLTDGCTVKTDTQNVLYTFRPPIGFTHTPDTTICTGQTVPLYLKPFGGDSTYDFYLLKNNTRIDSITNAVMSARYSFVITPTATTTYTIVLSDECTYLNDTQTIAVALRNPLSLAVTNDSIICRGQHLYIDVIPSGGDSTYALYLLNNNIIIDSVNNAVSNISYKFNELPALNANYSFVLKDDCTILNDTLKVNFGFRGPITFTHSTDPTICIGQSTNLTVTPFGGDSTYTIFLLKSNSPVDSILNATIGTNYNFTVAPVISTSYTISITDGCTIMNDTQGIIVQVRNPLKITIAHDTIICKGQTATIPVLPTGGDSSYSIYLLKNGVKIDSMTNALSNIQYKFFVSPIIKTVYEIIQEDGCTKLRDSSFITIDVYPPLLVKASISKPKICYGDSITLTALASGGAVNSVFTYLWNLGAGTTRISRIVPPASAWYIIKADDGCSTSAYDSVYIEVEPNPIADFSAANTSGCEPFTTQFKNITTTFSNVSYLWKFGDGGSDTSTTPPPHTFIKPGSYDVKLFVLSAFGCVDTMVRKNYITVHSNPQITLKINPKKVKVNNGKITFTAGLKFTDEFDFDFGDGISNISQLNSNNIFAHIYTDTGYFTVKLSARNNFGCSSELSDSLFIEDYYTVFIPNAFSPNNKDGINDYFRPVSTFSKHYEMVIYDRWGQLVYTETCNDRWFNCRGWDGTYHNQPVPEDTYIYTLTLYEEDGSNRYYEKGTVMVLR